MCLHLAGWGGAGLGCRQSEECLQTAPAVGKGSLRVCWALQPGLSSTEAHAEQRGLFTVTHCPQLPGEWGNSLLGSGVNTALQINTDLQTQITK